MARNKKPSGFSSQRVWVSRLVSVTSYPNPRYPQSHYIQMMCVSMSSHLIAGDVFASVWISFSISWLNFTLLSV